MSQLNGQIVAITGAGSGIGRALAIQLAKRGTKLAISDIHPDNLAETENLCRKAGVTDILTHHLDVANRNEVYAWAENINHIYGKVNIVINNAGAALNSTVADLRYEDFEWLMKINFWGVVYGSKAFLPYLEENKGHIVNISSLFGLISTPTTSAYNASKFAVRGFTESLNQEFIIMNKGLRATCVHPGGIQTNIVNNARITPNTNWGLTNTHTSNLNFQKIARTTSDEAASQIISILEKPKRPRLLIGRDAQLLDILQRLMPSAYQSLVAKASAKHRKSI